MNQFSEPLQTYSAFVFIELQFLSELFQNLLLAVRSRGVIVTDSIEAGFESTTCFEELDNDRRMLTASYETSDWCFFPGLRFWLPVNFDAMVI